MAAIIILFIFCVNTLASWGGYAQRPVPIELIHENDKKFYNEYNKKNYGWLSNIKAYSPNIKEDKTTAKFITEGEIELYFKLKLRNFVKDLEYMEFGGEKFLEATQLENLNRFNVNISPELNKYNKHQEIYFGILSISIQPFNTGNNYVYVVPIAGADTQIKKEIQNQIDDFVKWFAYDYYYILDLK